MSGQVYTYPRRVPPLYRLARAFRRASVLVLVLLILFTVSVIYSTSELTQSSSHVGSFSVAFGSNGTMILAGSLTLNNPGFYPIQALSLEARVVNETGGFLGTFGYGPVSLGAQATTEFPIELYLPVSATGPGASLLVETQYLNVSVWGNATFGYMFPASVTLQELRHWGAPFDHLAFTVQSPDPNGSIPVMLSFQNEASLTEAGILRISVVAANGITCGTTSWPMNVAPGQQFSQTQPIALSPGCSPVGGTVTGEFVTPAYSVPLPTEAIP
ncbi:MAG: hypothetical protein L3K10_02995 [Thermoplasmata archaeon]|nr:hypothetical protein [Thermoplasmata archaeon]